MRKILSGILLGAAASLAWPALAQTAKKPPRVQVQKPAVKKPVAARPAARPAPRPARAVYVPPPPVVELDEAAPLVVSQ